MAGQRQSTISADVEQLSLLPAKRTAPPVDLNYIKTLTNFRRAIRYSVSLPDLEPKEVYDPLDMDKSIWSRIENGGMSFPADQILALAKITQNKAPFLWLAHQFGFDIERLPLLRDDKDRRIAQLEADLAAAHAEKETMVKLWKETR